MSEKADMAKKSAEASVANALSIAKRGRVGMRANDPGFLESTIRSSANAIRKINSATEKTVAMMVAEAAEEVGGEQRGESLRTALLRDISGYGKVLGDAAIETKNYWKSVFEHGFGSPQVKSAEIKMDEAQRFVRAAVGAIVDGYNEEGKKFTDGQFRLLKLTERREKINAFLTKSISKSRGLAGGIGLVALDSLLSEASAAGFTDEVILNKITGSVSGAVAKLNTPVEDNSRGVNIPATSGLVVNLDDVNNARENIYKKMATIAAPGVERAADVFSILSRQVEKNLVGPAAKAGEQYGLWKLAWDDPINREFHYHNAYLFRQAVAIPWAIGQAMARGQMLGSKTGPALPDPAAVAKIYREEGSHWAEKNPAVVDSIVEIGLDPLWLAPPAVKAANLAIKAPQIRALMATIKEVRLAKNDAAGIAALAKGTRGAELSAQTVYAIRQTKDDALAAEFLYGLHYRPPVKVIEDFVGGVKNVSPEWASDMVDVGRKFFRRAGELHSPDIRDIDARYPQLMAALKENRLNGYRAVNKALGRKMTEDELEVVQKLWHTVPRDTADVRTTMAVNAEKMFSGETLTSRGVPKKWEGPRPPQELTNASIDGAELLGEAHRKGTASMEAYGPAKSTVEAAEARAAGLVEDSPAVNRYWQEHRTGGPGIFKEQGQLEKWMTDVITREFRSDKIDDFLNFTQGRINEIDGARKVAAKSGDVRLATQLKQDVADIVEMRKGIKDWSGTDVGIRAIKNMEPIPLLKTWEHVLNYTRAAQLAPNPAWYIKNFIDSKVVKNYVASGGEAWGGIDDILRAPVNKYRFGSGKVLDFGGTMADDIMKNLPGSPSELGNFMSKVENAARNQLGSWAYAKNYEKFKGLGISDEIADSKAFEVASKLVADVHINYQDLSAFDHIAKRIFGYPVYSIRNLGFWGTQALQHPSEANALVKAYEFQNDHLTVDRAGRLRLGDIAVDVKPLLSFNQAMRGIVSGDGVVPQEYEDTAKALKAAEFVASGTVPLIDIGAKALGLKDNQTEPSYLGVFDSGYKALSRSFGGDAATISGNFQRLLGVPPERDPSDADAWRFNLFLNGQRLDGNNPSVGEAIRQYNTESALSDGAAMLTGVRFVPMRNGEAKLNSLLKSYTEQSKNIPYDDQMYNYNLWKENYPELAPLLAIPKIDKAEIELNRIDSQKLPDQSSTMTGDELIRTALNTPLGRAISALLPAESASATSPNTDDAVKLIRDMRQQASDTSKQALFRDYSARPGVVPTYDWPKHLQDFSNKLSASAPTTPEQIGEAINKSFGYISTDYSKPPANVPPGFDWGKYLDDLNSEVTKNAPTTVDDFSRIAGRLHAAAAYSGVSIAGAGRAAQAQLLSNIESSGILPAPDMRLRVVNGKAMVARGELDLSDPKIANTVRLADKALSYHQNSLERIQSTEQKHRYIDDNGLSAYILQLGPEDTDSRSWGPLAQSYAAARGIKTPDGKPYGDITAATPDIRKKRDMVDGPFFSTLRSAWNIGGDTALRDLLFKASPDEVTARMKEFLPPGNKIAIDSIDLIELRSRFNPSVVTGWKMEKKAQTEARYPNTRHYEDHLSEAINEDTGDAPAVIELINKQIKAGDDTISPSFWTDLKSDKRKLYEAASVADRQKEINGVKNDITILDEQGRPWGLNTIAIQERISNGEAPFIAALELDGKTATGRMLRELRAKDPEAMSQIPTGAHTVGQYFGADFDFKTGIARHDLTDALFIRQGEVIPGAAQKLSIQQDFGGELPAIAYNFPPRISAEEAGESVRIRTQPYRSVGDMLQSFKSIHEMRVRNSAVAGITDPTWGSSASYAPFYKTKVNNPDGTTREGLAFDETGVNGIAALNSLAQTGLTLSGADKSDPDSAAGKAARSLGGLAAGIATFKGLMVFAPGVGGTTAGIGLIPYVAGALVVSAAVGITVGLTSRGKKKEGGGYTTEQLQAQAARIAEQKKLTDIRELSEKERNLAAAIRSGNSINRENIREQIERFRVRPSFGSRIGLVDAVQRELSSALKPRF